MLERIDSPNGRTYLTDKEKLPSVTTILDATSDKTSLQNWINYVGEKKAEEIKVYAGNVGTLLHTHLEMYIQDKNRPTGNNMIRTHAKQMADVIITNGLTKMDEYWGCEETLYYPSLYAGTTDLIGVYDSVPSICDYKNCVKLSSKDYKLPKYFQQLVAYALAHNELYNTNIRQGVIFMVDHKFNYETIILKGKDFNKAEKEWLNSLETYWKNQ